MKNTKEIEIEEGEIVGVQGQITEEDLELCLGSKYTAKVANFSGSRKRKLQLGHGDVCGRSRKIGKDTETIASDSDQTSSQSSTESTLFEKSGFVGCKQDEKSDIIAQKLKKFSFYTPEEEEIERVSQVSTKLKLYEDPWKIKKVLWQSESDTFHRLILGKEVVERFVLPLIKIDEKILENNGKEFKVWDYDTKTEHVLKLEKWPVNYVFTNWKTEFVKRRGLKSGYEIGMFWNTAEDRFWFRVVSTSLRRLHQSLWRRLVAARDHAARKRYKDTSND